MFYMFVAAITKTTKASEGAQEKERWHSEMFGGLDRLATIHNLINYIKLPSLGFFFWENYAVQQKIWMMSVSGMEVPLSLGAGGLHAIRLYVA